MRTEEDQRRRVVIYGLVALALFVFLHSFIPSDPRVRMGFKPFEVEWGLTPAEVWYAVKKWRHLLWFAIFFPLVRTLFRESATIKAIFTILFATVLIEFQQAFIAGRHCRLADVLPNLLGSLTGAILIESWRRWRKRRHGPPAVK